MTFFVITCSLATRSDRQLLKGSLESLSPAIVKEKLHRMFLQSGKKDFVQDYCSKGEKLSSILLKQKIGRDFRSCGKLAENYRRMLGEVAQGGEVFYVG